MLNEKKPIKRNVCFNLIRTCFWVQAHCWLLLEHLFITLILENSINLENILELHKKVFTNFLTHI